MSRGHRSGSRADEHDPVLEERTGALVAAAGYGRTDPLVVGVQREGGPPVFAVRGRSAGPEAISARTVVYTASLTKQVTAACAALLVRQGRLDLESTLAAWLPELPPWAGEVRVRHLIFHTSGLPDVASYDDLERAGLDRTTAGVVEALRACDRLEQKPGAEHRYSNAGYVCLGLVVARAAGLPFAAVVRERVCRPLGLTRSCVWDGPAVAPPGAAPLNPPQPAPLSQGDGGFWSSAEDLLRWNLAMDRDALGIATVVQTPGQLDDGTPLDYAWGLDVGEQAGRRFYRHGGRWAGLSAQLVRVAGQASSVVVLALDDDEDRAAALTQRLIEELAR